LEPRDSTPFYSSFLKEFYYSSYNLLVVERRSTAHAQTLTLIFVCANDRNGF